MVDVVLAGYNVDVEYLKELQDFASEVASGVVNRTKAARLAKLELTPETLSAANARISRDPKPVTTLRKRSRKRVAKARDSNEHIVFGLGHSSVAEHAVFNFDILNLSRLATEWLEEHRLCSYTEKSQRYITLKDDDFMNPKEITGENLEKMLELREQKKELYFEAFPLLFELQKNKHPEMIEEKLKTLEGWAKEDARYCVDMTTVAQLGMTANARNIEKMVRTGRCHPSEEVRELSEKVYQTVYSIAPSLLSRTNAENFEKAYGNPLEEEFLKHGREDAKKATENFVKAFQFAQEHFNTKDKDVALIHYDPFLDDRIVKSLAFNNTTLPFFDIAYLIGRAKCANKEKYVKDVLKNLSKHDAVPREFENIDFLFGLAVSASCYAQLKRHRMSTQIMQEYDPNLGYTIPESVKEISFEQKYQNVMDQSSELFYEIQKTHPAAASYVLTNGHKRRVLFKANARELYAFSRLREDCHAQWDIRDKAHKMIELARIAAPITMMLAGGKDGFDDLKKEVYGEKDGTG